MHEPQTECIAKGKAHKRYEFGVKTGLVTSARASWVLGAQTFPGNPYDGHTLQQALEQAKRITGVEPEQACADLGYRKKGRCWLAGAAGDALHTLLTAVGFNLRKLMKGLKRLFLCLFPCPLPMVWPVLPQAA